MSCKNVSCCFDGVLPFPFLRKLETLPDYLVGDDCLEKVSNESVKTKGRTIMNDIREVSSLYSMRSTL